MVLFLVLSGEVLASNGETCAEPLKEAAHPRLKYTTLPGQALDRLMIGAPTGATPASYALDEESIRDLELTALAPLIHHAKSALGRKRAFWDLTHPLLDVDAILDRQRSMRLLMDTDLGELMSERLASVSGPLDNLFAREFYFGDSGRELVQRGIGLLGVGLTGAMLYTNGFPRGLIGPLYMSMMTVGATEAYKPLRRSLHALRELIDGSRELVQVPVVDPLISQKLSEISTLVSDPKIVELRKRLRFIVKEQYALILNVLYFHEAWANGAATARARSGIDLIIELADRLAELDALVADARFYAQFREKVVFPEIANWPGGPRLELEEAHHPYAFFKPGSVSVPNEMKMAYHAEDPHSPSFVIVTGQELSGKSTYVRMAAVTSLMAQRGLPVPARRALLSPLQVFASFRVDDSLASGKSFFDAETDRLLAILEGMEGRENVFLALDELVRGTNPPARLAIERATVAYLTERPVLTALTTHHLPLTDLAQTNGRIRLRQSEERQDEGELRFTYRILQGAAQRSESAIEVLRLKAFPAALVERAAAEYRRVNGSVHDNGDSLTAAEGG